MKHRYSEYSTCRLKAKWPRRCNNQENHSYIITIVTYLSWFMSCTVDKFRKVLIIGEALTATGTKMADSWNVVP
jgi:hypothetical protein